MFFEPFTAVFSTRSRCVAGSATAVGLQLHDAHGHCGGSDPFGGATVGTTNGDLVVKTKGFL